MSDRARDLLIHGIAAAKGNSKDEARHYLEWVLITDAEPEQEAEAHYWLSQVSDDRVEKRQHLEQVLAAFPNHPEARRDIAILDGRLDPGEMIDFRHVAPPHTPSGQVAPDDVRRFRCPKCGGRMTTNPARGGLFCQFCGHTPAGDGEREAPPVAQAGHSATPVDEQDWVAAIYTRRGHSWVLPASRSLVCQGCGAHVTMLPNRVSGRCPFCGSAHFVETEESADLIEPHGVVPFAFDDKAALAHARRWLEAEPFRPDDLDERAGMSLPRPVYLPLWTFDLHGEVRWTGTLVQKQFGRVAYTRTGGSVPLVCDDLQVPATHSLPADLLAQLSFDTRSIVPYSPALLADWPAEIYSLSLADASLKAREQAFNDAVARVRDDIKTYVTDGAQNIRAEGVDLAVSSYKLLLVPVWVTEYAYKSDSYQALINGQTGHAHGAVPRNPVHQFLDSIFNR